MRRNLVLFAIICLFPLQSIFAQTQPEIKLGLKFAPDISFMVPSTKDYNNNGVKLGGVLGLKRFLFCRALRLFNRLQCVAFGRETDVP